MGSEFNVVTDIRQIARLNKKLAARLKETFKYREVREVGFPSGHRLRRVSFEEPSGEHIRAWAPLGQDDKLVNLLLYGEPHATARMEIAVQLNFPAEKYNRMMAGAFVTDVNGDEFIAHRGKLTKGNAGLPKAAVFREFAPSVVEASDGTKTSQLILIAALDAPDLVVRLFEFAREVRKVATRLASTDIEDASGEPIPGNGKAAGARGIAAKPSPAAARLRLMKLRQYFDEYAGEGQMKGHGGGTRTVEHGDIVKALEAKLRHKGLSQKAQAIDLAIVLADAVDLFEVKTCARTTDVYTGVGQLLIHGACISEELALPVHRYLVLPSRPNEMHAKHIVAKGAMAIVTYKKKVASGAYSFSGL